MIRDGWMLAGLLCGVAACVAPSGAVAQPRAEAQLSVGFAPVHRSAGDAPNALVGGLAVFVTVGPLKGGPVITLAEALEGRVRDESFYAGFALGHTREFASGWQVAVLSEGGIHDVFTLTDRDLDSFDSVSMRDDVILPYAGLRAGVTFERAFERSWTGLWSKATSAGIGVFVRRDLRRGTATLDYAEWGYWWGPDLRGTATYEVGGWTAGVTLTLSTRW